MCRAEATEKKKKMRQPLIRIELGQTAGRVAVNKVNVADLQFIFSRVCFTDRNSGKNVKKGRNEYNFVCQ